MPGLVSPSPASRRPRRTCLFPLRTRFDTLSSGPFRPEPGPSARRDSLRLLSAPVSKLGCNHYFCGDCLKAAMTVSSRCPSCKAGASRRRSRPAH